MRIKFTKHQIQILAILHMIILVLFVGIMFLPKGETPISGKPTPQPDPAVHNKYRSPMPGLRDTVEWEISLGGSGNEKAEYCYETADTKLIVTGTTTSSDYDFAPDEQESGGADTKNSGADTENGGSDAQSGGSDAQSGDSATSAERTFIITLSKTGKPESYKLFAGSLVKSAMIDSASPLGAGILLLVSATDGDFLVHSPLDAERAATRVPILPETPNVTVKAIDLLVRGDLSCVDVVTKNVNKNETLATIGIYRFNYSLELIPGAGALIYHDEHLISLEYAGLLPYGKQGYTVAAQINDTYLGYVLLYRWDGNGPATVFRSCKTSRKYTLLEFTQYGGGYASLIKFEDNGLSVMLAPDTLNGTIQFVDTGIEDSVSAGMHYVDAALSASRAFIVNSINSIKISTVKKFSYDFRSGVALSSLSGMSELNEYRQGRGNIYIGGRYMNSAPAMFVTVDTQDDFKRYDFGTSSDTIKNILPDNGYCTVVSESGAKGIDVSAHFGGTDIWIAKIVL